MDILPIRSAHPFAPSCLYFREAPDGLEGATVLFFQIRMIRELLQ